jgi:hypothetical protein
MIEGLKYVRMKFREIGHFIYATKQSQGRKIALGRRQAREKEDI